MPELPEVETIVRSLNTSIDTGKSTIINKEIVDALVLWERTLANQIAEEFTSRVKNQRIQSIHRRGKFLVLTLTRDTILVHLRMSGDLRVEKITDDSNVGLQIRKHDRIVLFFDNKTYLAFNNPRKFGRIWLLDDPQEVLGKLGPEPLSDELNADRFHTMLTDHHRQLKPLLMDQHFLAGMGNIYTDEALFHSKLHPLVKSHTLSKKQSTILLNSIRAVLKEGIIRNGASIDWVYQGGDFQNFFRVYGRKGEPCLTCSKPIERLLVGQRGTYICSKCQKL